MPTTDRFSLEALEFRGVIERLGAHCQTAPGRARLAALAPSAIPGEAREGLVRCQEALGLRELEFSTSLAGIEDLRPVVEHLSQGGRPLEPPDLAAIANTVLSMEGVRTRLTAVERRAPRLAAVAAAIPDLTDLAAAIRRCVDERGDVLDTASPKLAGARGRERAARAEVERTMERLLVNPEIRKVLHAPKHSYRNDRPVIAVKAEFRQRVAGLLLDRSASGNTVYIEPEAVVELGNLLAECSLVIAREISGLLLEFSRRVLGVREKIELSMQRIGELDMEFAKGAFAKEFHCCIPEIVVGRRLRITGGRHPKLAERELTSGNRRESAVTPIDLEVGGEFDLLVITGPNTGGKTVALKTFGLLAAMALSGLPVPARDCQVPLLDGIFVDVGDEQEIAQSLSTFSSHMVRVERTVRLATRDSLVLLDEVGAGTDPADGAALGEAILEYLLHRGARTIATTHLGKLKELAFRYPRSENATVEFDPETLEPRYRIILGVPGVSQALTVARRVGIPNAILDRAERALERKDSKAQEAMAAIQSARIEADAVRRRAEESLEESDRVKSIMEGRMSELDKRAEAIGAEAQRLVDESISRLRTRLRDSLNPILTVAPKPLEERLTRFRDDLEGAIAQEPIERKREEFVSRLKRDSIIYVPKLRRRCVVKKVNKDKRTVTVMVGDLPAEVRFDEVTWYEVL